MTDKTKKEIENMHPAPEYKIIGQRSAFYCIEKNGMPMTAEQVLAELKEKIN